MTEQEILQYREDIIKAMLDYRGPDGFPVILEDDARELLSELSDNELSDGYLFNSPADVAEILLED